MQPSKLALVPEAQEDEKIKAQHSLSKAPADAVQDEHTAKKLKPTDGSTIVDTPLLNDKVPQPTIEPTWMPAARSSCTCSLICACAVPD